MGRRIRRLAVGTSALASLYLLLRASSTSSSVPDDDFDSMTADRLDSRPIPKPGRLAASSSSHPDSDSSSSPFAVLPETMRILAQADYCPKTGSAAMTRPAVVLAPFEGGQEDPLDDSARTAYLSRQTNEARRTSSVGFFPWSRRRGLDEPPRFSNGATLGDDRGTFEGEDDGEVRFDNRTSKNKANGWSPSCLRFMFGMATTPSRALRSLPIWDDWLSPTSHLSVSPLLVLVPPDTERDLAWELERRFRAVAPRLEATARSVPADRFERRYFRLVAEMWTDATVRALIREGEEDMVDWFVLADDDTYFLSLEALSREIEIYDPASPYILGGLSENPLQIETFGKMAYGGGSILLSRGLMELLNRPGQFEECEREFGGLFGGDGMVTSCAAKVMNARPGQVVTYLTTLHQLDVQGHAMGVFQAGWRFNTLHHWNSWMRIFDPTHPTSLHDDFESIMLIGKAARAVGIENWGRRYVWGLNPPRDRHGKGKGGENVVVALGYSVTVHRKGVVDRVTLEHVEHTFVNSEVFQATRPPVEEGVGKRTYYLVDCRVAQVDGKSGDPTVVVLRHVDADGETFDVIWDARASFRRDGEGGEGGRTGKVGRHAREWSKGVIRHVDKFAKRHHLVS